MSTGYLLEKGAGPHGGAGALDGSAEAALAVLSAREMEVARLVAAGLTNREIAVALTIAPKTASAHVEHILTKLGVSRRAQIAVLVAALE